MFVIAAYDCITNGGCKTCVPLAQRKSDEECETCSPGFYKTSNESLRCERKHALATFLIKCCHVLSLVSPPRTDPTGRSINRSFRIYSFSHDTVAFCLLPHAPLVAYGGLCENGELAEQKMRTANDQCGKCPQTKYDMFLLTNGTANKVPTCKLDEIQKGRWQRMVHARALARPSYSSHMLPLAERRSQYYALGLQC